MNSMSLLASLSVVGCMCCSSIQGLVLHPLFFGSLSFRQRSSLQWKLSNLLKFRYNSTRRDLIRTSRHNTEPNINRFPANIHASLETITSTEAKQLMSISNQTYERKCVQFIIKGNKISNIGCKSLIECCKYTEGLLFRSAILSHGNGFHLLTNARA